MSTSDNDNDDRLPFLGFFTVVAVISSAVVTLMAGYQCGEIADIYDVGHRWSVVTGCYLEAPDGRLVLLDDWWRSQQYATEGGV